VGIVTEKNNLHKRLENDKSGKMLNNFLNSTVELKRKPARACFHSKLKEFSINDFSALRKEMSNLRGVSYGGIIG